MKYVRPGKYWLRNSCHHVWGSGGGSVSLTTEGIKGPSRDAGSNGFLRWTECQVTLAEGQSAIVDEWYYPGGERTTEYVANLGMWREQRRKHLTQVLQARRDLYVARKSFEDRKQTIEALLRKAINRGYRRWAMALATTWQTEIVQQCNVGLGDLTSNVLRWEWLNYYRADRMALPSGCDVVLHWLNGSSLREVR